MLKPITQLLMVIMRILKYYMPRKDGKFYMYPTSDGFDGWSGNYFKAFSSTDLVTWKDEGVILDLPKDVSWAKRMPGPHASSRKR
jgi:hypothetical protein